jgi:hypothetical protein
MGALATPPGTNPHAKLPMPRTAKVKNSKTSTQSSGNGIAALTAQLWQAAVNLRGSIEPADYKRYVLPIIFLRFLSLRYERRRAELERLIADPANEYYTTDPRIAADILANADESRFRLGAMEVVVVFGVVVERQVDSDGLAVNQLV